MGREGIIKLNGTVVYQRYDDFTTVLLPGNIDKSYWNIYGEEISEHGNYSIELIIFERGAYDSGKSDDILLDNKTVYVEL